MHVYVDLSPDPLSHTRVWTPGPENSGWKKRYLFGMFIFIQDMVERAMAEELVGQRIPTPGVYLQQMPYPCYQKDRYYVGTVVCAGLGDCCVCGGG